MEEKIQKLMDQKEKQTTIANWKNKRKIFENEQSCALKKTEKQNLWIGKGKTQTLTEKKDNKTYALKERKIKCIQLTGKKKNDNKTCALKEKK